MREAIGGTWLMQLVIIFMLIFVAFLALTLNYTKAFKMKNEVLTIIEKQDGLTEKSIETINNYLRSNAYGIMKNCPEGSYGISDLNSNTAESVGKKSTKKYYYCVSKIESTTSNYPTHDDNKGKGKYYYKVNLFLKFNLPVLGDIFTFDINGSTNDIVNVADGRKSLEVLTR